MLPTIAITIVANYRELALNPHVRYESVGCDCKHGAAWDMVGRALFQGVRY